LGSWYRRAAALTRSRLTGRDSRPFFFVG
jgi:hypothetical protein